MGWISEALEVGVGHDEDEGEGAFEEVDDDAVFAFDGFDAAGAALEGTIDDEDGTGVFELLEFVGCEDADVVAIGGEGALEGIDGAGGYAHVGVMGWDTMFVGIGVGRLGAVVDVEELVGIEGEEVTEGVRGGINEEEVGEDIAIAELGWGYLLAIARGIEGDGRKGGFRCFLCVEGSDEGRDGGNGTRSKSWFGAHDIPDAMGDGVVVE